MNSNNELIKQHHSRHAAGNSFKLYIGQEVNRWPAVAAVENSGFPAAAAVDLSGWPAAAAVEDSGWPAAAAVKNSGPPASVDVEVSGPPAAAAVEDSGWPAAAAENQRSSREAQLSPDAFEPIPSEEVQDHFSPGKKNLFYTDIF